jgi:hypothetical protein
MGDHVTLFSWLWLIVESHGKPCDMVSLLLNVESHGEPCDIVSLLWNVESYGEPCDIVSLWLIVESHGKPCDFISLWFCFLVILFPFDYLGNHVVDNLEEVSWLASFWLVYKGVFVTLGNTTFLCTKLRLEYKVVIEVLVFERPLVLIVLVLIMCSSWYENDEAHFLCIDTCFHNLWTLIAEAVITLLR